MGFSSPKAVTPAAAPPPVTTTGADVAAASDAERKAQQKRQGYAATISQPGKSTLLTMGATTAATGRKTLLGGN